MNKELYEELAKLKGQLDTLGTAIEHIDKAKNLSKSVIENGKALQKRSDDQIEEVKNVIQKFEELTKASEEIVKEIEKVDFPSRLDKIDNTVSGINQSAQNIMTRLENVSKDLKDQLKEHHDHSKAELMILKNATRTNKNIIIAFGIALLILSVLISYKTFF